MRIVTKCPECGAESIIATIITDSFGNVVGYGSVMHGQGCKAILPKKQIKSWGSK